MPPFSFNEVVQIVESEFGVPPDELFESLNDTSFASASIGQVHRAVLKDGEEVAVKFQRPGIQRIIEVDLEIMLHLATLAERHIEEMSLLRPVKSIIRLKPRIWSEQRANF